MVGKEEPRAVRSDLLSNVVEREKVHNATYGFKISSFQDLVSSHLNAS